jgi:hypothetical protein
MKQRQCWYACDTCDTDSEPATTFTGAKILAKRAGWLISADFDTCPKCLAGDAA